MNKLIIALFLTASVKAQDETTVKLIRLQHAVPSQVREALSAVPVGTSGENGLHAIVLKGRPADVARAEQMVKELDEAPDVASSRKDVELTFNLVRGSDKSLDNSKPLGDAAEAVQQLRRLFPYSRYENLETVFLRASTQRSTSTTGFLGNIGANLPNNPARYHMDIDIGDVSGQPVRIRFSKVAFSVQFMAGNGYQTAEILQAVTVREGQKVVLGTTDLGSDNGALFLIVSAKAVD